MARRRINGLGMACGRPIAAAVIGRTPMRSAFDDLPRYPDVGRLRIVTCRLRSAGGFGNAACLRLLPLSAVMRGTSARPGIGGRAVRLPVSRARCSVRTRVSPARRRKRSFLPSRRACSLMSRIFLSLSMLRARSSAPSFASRRARSMTAAKSIFMPVTCMPRTPPCVTSAASRAEAIIALLGVQPKFTQEPRRCSRSNSTTGRPAADSARARGTPAGPAPIIAVSVRCAA
jgi:hypothetical protein